MNSTNEAKTFLKACSDGLLDLVYPPKCCVCGEVDRPAICTDCAAKLTPLPKGSCGRCAIDGAGDRHVCKWMTAVDIMRGAVDYQGAGGIAVRQLKFARAIEAAKPMALYMLSAMQGVNFDYAVPVPIHWSRRSYRGFNQAELLAKHTGLPYRSNLLSRTKATWPQARSSAQVRRSGLEGAFRSKPCPGARVLLVDDVITSGGTVEACAQELKARGASWVGALAFAIELPSDFRVQASGSSTP
jgi:ComF family protein